MLWAALLPAFAQVQVGVTAGVPLSPAILDTSTGGRYSASQVDSAARRYSLGPSIEFPIAGPLSIETGFLYKRFGFDSTAVFGPLFGPTVRVNTSTTGSLWEFPILARTRWRLTPRSHLVLSAGPVLRYASHLHERGTRTITFTLPPPTRVTNEAIDTREPATFDRRASFGGAAGAGVEFTAGPWRFTPTVRFTRWDTERTASIPSASRLGRAQFDALLTIAHTLDGGVPRTAPRPRGSFEFGLLAGVPLLSNTEIEFAPYLLPRTLDAPTRRWAAGAFLAWNLHPRLALEAGFLTRRFGHTDTTHYTNYDFAESVSGTVWEVPLLARYRFLPLRPLTPSAGIGPALRRAGNVDWWAGAPGSCFRLPGGTISRTAWGMAASAGVEASLGSLRLRPELRFFLWNRRLYETGSVRARDHSLLAVVAVGYARAK